MNKNSKLLKSFVKYAEKHPEMRLWQALRGWSKVPFLVAVEDSLDLMDNINMEGGVDTFNWTKKNELPKSNPKKN